MKKMMIVLGLATLLAACSTNGSYEPWDEPQQNAQEAAGNVAFSAQANADSIDYNTNVKTDTVTLFTAQATASEPIASQRLGVTLYSADKTASVHFVPGQDGRVTAAELKDAIETLYGKSGTLHEVPVTVNDTILLSSGAGFIKTADITSRVKLVKPAFDIYLYAIGHDSHWKTTHELYSENGDGVYEGFAWLSQAFKFRPNADNWDDAYGYVSDGKLSQKASDNIPVAQDGFYQMKVNLAEGTYELNLIEQLSLIGNALQGWKADVDMTWNADEQCWEYQGTLNKGEFKVRMNHQWATSWGGKADGKDLSHITDNGGKNITVDDPGTYLIRFYLTDNDKSKIVLTRQ